MNLALSQEQWLLAYCQETGWTEFGPHDLARYGASRRLSSNYLRLLLHRLEKQNHLVRIRRGVYMTMEAYVQRATGGSDESSAIPLC